MESDPPAPRVAWAGAITAAALTAAALTAAALTAAALLAAAYWTTLQWLWGRWLTDPFYSHGPLVPLVSAAILWKGRRNLALRPAARGSAILILTGAALLHLLGVRLYFEFLSSISLIAMLAGVALLAGGAPLLRAAAFPIAYLLLAIPLPRVILEQVSLPLQLAGSAGAAALLRGLGVPAVRDGVHIIFPEFTLVVADACSGLRSLITVLAISSLVALLTPASTFRRLILVASSALAALAANLFRIVVTGLVGLAFGGRAASVFFEHYSGFVFFALVVLAALGIASLLVQPRRAPEPPPALPPRHSPAACLCSLLLILCLTAGATLLLRTTRSTRTPASLSSWSPAVDGWRVVQTRDPGSPPGETWLAGILEGTDGRPVAFTVVHSVTGRYLHSPEACSVAAGWTPERREARTPADRLPVNLWVMRRGDERVLLVFWYSLAGRPVRGSVDHHAGALWQRLKTGGTDSAYVEVSLPVRPGEKIDEDRLLSLAAALHGQVSRRIWPDPR